MSNQITVRVARRLPMPHIQYSSYEIAMEFTVASTASDAAGRRLEALALLDEVKDLTDACTHEEQELLKRQMPFLK